ncbi:FGGY family carbohydrate kinase [Neptunomonas qingdaonensis]|uniref:Glycerol kinase n=1 Tax=Neptunomonas qingdaonensis TaxID=1045558 RepID=A0A1I2LG93_9GAMM|nr:FGGY family carbohydrate kinase [Neptunomonas qingdaonensis]SFF78043.1 glycerol kinase [Neptunomonas qingdaonensis]
MLKLIICYTLFMDFTLAIDQGTHASRAILYDSNGRTIDSEWQSVELQRLSNGHIEQDALQILRSIEVCIEQVLQKIPASQRNQIRQCGLATQRSTLVPCDESGQPVASAVSWQDTRATGLIETLPDKKQRIQDISGLPLSAHYGASKMRWILDQQRDQQQPHSALRLLPLSSYLLKHLTRSDAFVVDPANAQRTQLMDIRTCDWSKELLSLYAIPKHVLPDCVASCRHFGTLLDTGIPLTAANGDQNAALFAAGEPEANTAYINLGSGGFVLYPIREVQLQAPLLTSIGYTDAQSSRYFLEGTVNGAGSALNWIRKQYPKDDWWEQLPQWLAAITAPPIFINSIGNIGSPWWNTDLKPKFFNSINNNMHNSNESHSIEHRAVAVVESILFLLLNNLDLMRDSATTIRQLYLSGGVSRLDGLCQKLANLSQLPVIRFEARETTAKGIAWLAHSERPVWPHRINRTFTPEKDPGLVDRYQTFTNYLKNHA